MKTIKQFVLLTGLTGGLFAPMVGQAADEAPATNSPTIAARAERTNEAAPAPEEPVPAPAPAPEPAAPAAEQKPTPPPTAAQPAEQPPAVQASASVEPVIALTPGAADAAITNGEKGLRLNFRGVPLDMVLNYLSDAAGFIIVLETQMKGKVDVWSNQPLSKEEAVTLLNTILNKNGYAAIQNGRTLTIVSRDDARKKDIPVKSGNNPLKIPKNDEIVTQIIPVRSLNAVQLTKDLAPLLPSDTTLTANESGNSLVMTDTQTNIRRMAEIIRALDSVSSSVNSIRVFPLRYADAKTVSSLIKDLFPSQDSSRTGGNSGGGFGRFRGGFGGFPGGFPGGGGDGGGADSGNGHTPSTRVSAVADDHSNSLVVSAPEDLIPTIDELVKSVDVVVEDATEVRVFHLKNADPSEMSDLLSNLFPDESNSTDATRSQPRFGFGFGPFGGGQGGNNNNNTANSSERMKKIGRVISVPDRRTASVVVSAAKQLMPEIAAMVEQLDTNPAKKQKVFVYSLQNADVQDVQQVLQDLFQTSNNSRSGSSANSSQNNPLTTRSQTLQQQQLSGSGSATGTSFGNGNSGGGRGF
jgi:general secretion pathway protein D